MMLQKSYRQLEKEPLEGFFFEPNASNFFEWKIYLEGPQQTPFEGGVFELLMNFPSDYPMSPPTLRFISQFWHPNVYKDGKVCISILHPPGDDPLSGERPEERWLPTQTVETIMLSVQSMLGDPNFSSAANVDASVECRDHFSKYSQRIKTIIQKAPRLPPHVQIAHPSKEKKPIVEEKIDDYDFDVDVDIYGDYGYDFEDDNEEGSDPVHSEDSEQNKPKKENEKPKPSKSTTDSKKEAKPKKEKLSKLKSSEDQTEKPKSKLSESAEKSKKKSKDSHSHKHSSKHKNKEDSSKKEHKDKDKSKNHTSKKEDKDKEKTSKKE
uniref:UBC core domain-containing protein n=1 Tax=Arcella intermedia TaxID=1963864 RepID=A0A6B2LA11_9EUKA